MQTDMTIIDPAADPLNQAFGNAQVNAAGPDKAWGEAHWNDPNAIPRTVGQANAKYDAAIRHRADIEQGILTNKYTVQQAYDMLHNQGTADNFNTLPDGSHVANPTGDPIAADNPYTKYLREQAAGGMGSSDSLNPDGTVHTGGGSGVPSSARNADGSVGGTGGQATSGTNATGNPLLDTYLSGLENQIKTPGIGEGTIEGIINRGNEGLANSEMQAKQDLGNRAAAAGFSDSGALQQGIGALDTQFAGQKAANASNTRISAAQQAEQERMQALGQAGGYLGQQLQLAQAQKSQFMNALGQDPLFAASGPVAQIGAPVPGVIDGGKSEYGTSAFSPTPVNPLTAAGGTYIGNDTQGQNFTPTTTGMNTIAGPSRNLDANSKDPSLQPGAALAALQGQNPVGSSSAGDGIITKPNGEFTLVDPTKSTGTTDNTGGDNWNTGQKAVRRTATPFTDNPLAQALKKGFAPAVN